MPDKHEVGSSSLPSPTSSARPPPNEEGTRLRGHSSAGRARALQARGQRFDPACLHQRSTTFSFKICARMVEGGVTEPRGSCRPAGEFEIGSSCKGQAVDALAPGGDEGRRSLRNAPSSWQASDDTGMSEWGNPVRVMPDYPRGSQRGELKHLSTRRKVNQTRLP